MSLGLIIIGATINIYIMSIKGSSDTVKSARLNYDMEAAMQLMTNDIRRSGYWGGAITGSNSTLNPFTTGDANIRILDYTDADGDTHTDGCILYTYDVDDGDTTTTPDLADGNVNLNEYYGFRMDRNAIWMRSSVLDADADGVPDATGCGDGNWERIIDEDNISIQKLKFSNDTDNNQYKDYKCLNTSTSPDQLCSVGISAGDLAVETRQIFISISGVVINDTSVSKTLSGIVKVRNNRIYVQ